MLQGYSLCHRKPPKMFEIAALFRQVMLYINTKKKTNHCKIIIHSSLLSESNVYYNNIEMLIDNMFINENST